MLQNILDLQHDEGILLQMSGWWLPAGLGVLQVDRCGRPALRVLLQMSLEMLQVGDALLQVGVDLQHNKGGMLHIIRSRAFRRESGVVGNEFLQQNLRR